MNNWENANNENIVKSFNSLFQEKNFITCGKATSGKTALLGKVFGPPILSYDGCITKRDKIKRYLKYKKEYREWEKRQQHLFVFTKEDALKLKSDFDKQASN